MQTPPIPNRNSFSGFEYDVWIHLLNQSKGRHSFSIENINVIFHLFKSYNLFHNFGLSKSIIFHTHKVRCHFHEPCNRPTNCNETNRIRGYLILIHLYRLPTTDQPTRCRKWTESNSRSRAMSEAKRSQHGPNESLIGTEGDAGPNSFNLTSMMIWWQW